MKTNTKLLLALAAAMVATASAFAQGDTIYYKYPRYHHSDLYDTTPYFPDTCNSTWPYQWFGCREIGFHGDTPVAKEQFTSERMAVKGFAITVSKNRRNHVEPYQPLYTPGSPKLPEYAFLAHYENDSMYRFSDSLRWDTASPKTMIFPLSRNTANCFYDCDVYEAYFDKPVIVDSSFFIVWTKNSNVSIEQNFSVWYPYTPTLLVGIDGPQCSRLRSFCYNRPGWWVLQNSSPASTYMATWWGGAFPIVDRYNLVARPEEECDTMGTVSGSGHFSSDMPLLITARPNAGFYFQHWNDGNTDNPRTIILTQDTLFTATFAVALPCTAEVLSNDTSQGTVSGSGIFLQGDTVTFTAYPNTGYALRNWCNGCTANPYRFVITHDTSVTAYFWHRGYFHLDVSSNNRSQGYTTGSGNFWELDTATIRAVAHVGYTFQHWNDGNSDNPRSVVITQDTAFTAYFANPDDTNSANDTTSHQSIETPTTGQPLFTLNPNPAHHSVTVTLNTNALAPSGTLTLSDASGRELLTLPVGKPVITLPLNPYPAGVYFLTLRTQQATVTQKLAIK